MIVYGHFIRKNKMIHIYIDLKKKIVVRLK